MLAAASERTMARRITAGVYSFGASSPPAAETVLATSQMPAKVIPIAPQIIGAGRAPSATDIGTATAG